MPLGGGPEATGTERTGGAADDSVDAALTPARLLLIGAAAELRDAMGPALAGLDHALAEAADGADALAHVAAEPVDMVLLDQTHPDAAALPARLATAAGPRRPVILAIRPADDPDGISRALAAGADDVLARPVHPGLLRARVAAAIEARRLRARETALRETMAATRFAQAQQLHQAQAAARAEIQQLQETIRALRHQLDLLGAQVKAEVATAHAAATAEIRQLRATCKVLREQYDAAISGRAGAAPLPPLPGEAADGR